MTFILHTIGLLVRALTTMYLFNWFVVPALGLQNKITFSIAFGLTLFTKLCIIQFPSSVAKELQDETSAEVALTNIFFCLILLSMGWLVSL